MTNNALAGRANSLQELCSHDGRDFIRSAYLTVLGRLPDEEGFAFYLSRLDQGFSKLTILRQLRISAEARGHDPGIAGFDRALKKHRRGNLSMIGWAYRLFSNGESDSPSARDRRALLHRLGRVEATLHVMHADLEERLDRGAFQRGPQRSFGIVSARQQMAQPWTAHGSI